MNNQQYGGMYGNPKMPKLKGKLAAGNVGNVCAYAPDTPVQYNKPKFAHYPSQDYSIPHPKGFLHTQLTKETRRQYAPYSAYYQDSNYITPHMPYQFTYPYPIGNYPLL